MEALENLEDRVWWNYVESDIQELLYESQLLLRTLKGMGADLPGARREFHDYSFVVFPAAKAFEGFLKKLFLDLGFITDEDYFGKRFRIGKALNPSLEKEIRREGVYDKIVDHCQGKEVAEKLWETWKESRNVIFHWFPNEKNAINLLEAEERIKMIVDAIDTSFRGCKINGSRS